MNFTSMEYFLAVAEHRNVTRAARGLHITQQTLSAHIAGLERELGCKLFVRSSPLELTEGGRLFLRYATEFNERFRAMRSEFGDLEGNPRGTLRIGIAHTRGRAILPDAIPAFQADFPNVEVALLEGNNDEVRGKLHDREVDLAIGRFDRPEPGIAVEAFYEEEVVLVVRRDLLPADAPPSESELSDLSLFEGMPFVLGSEGDVAGRLGRTILRASGVRHLEPVQSGNTETILALCLRGAGACFVPDLLMRVVLTEDQRADLATYHLGERAVSAIQFAYRTSSYQWSAVAGFMDAARKALPKEALPRKAR